VLKCGQKRVWIDPNETSEVKLANSRKSLACKH
jgi:ribosomal protein L19E